MSERPNWAHAPAPSAAAPAPPTTFTSNGLPALCGKNLRSRRSRLAALFAFFPLAIAGGP